MNVRSRHLRAVPTSPTPPPIEDTPLCEQECDCLCGLWLHSGICTGNVDVTEKNPDRSVYHSCQPCYDDMLRKAADL